MCTNIYSTVRSLDLSLCVCGCVCAVISTPLAAACTLSLTPSPYLNSPLCFSVTRGSFINIALAQKGALEARLSQEKKIGFYKNKLDSRVCTL